MLDVLTAPSVRGKTAIPLRGRSMNEPDWKGPLGDAFADVLGYSILLKLDCRSPAETARRGTELGLITG